jgi:hypothetical protein
MKTLLIPLLLVFAALSHFQSPPGIGAEPIPAWAARNTAGHEVRIAVAPPDDARFAHLSWNKVVRTPKGTVVLAYIAGTFHGNHGGGSPAVSRSTDGGQTYSAPQVLREFAPGLEQTHSGNLAMGIAEDGALVVLAMAFDGDKSNHIYGWRSEDDGVNWTATDTSTLGPNKTGSVFGSILPVQGRGLVALGHYRAGSTPYTQGIWMATSGDHGRCWSEARRIANVPAVEPMLVKSADRLVGFFRGETKNLGGRQYVGVSDDNGETWTTELSVLDAEVPKAARLAAPHAVENVNKPGELLVLTTERAVSGNTPGRIWLWRGSTSKLEWQRERVLLEVPQLKNDPHTDFGYPWLLHVGGNRWQMYYYHGRSKGYCPLWVTEVKL